MKTQTLRGRKVIGGKASGEAAVSATALCFRSEFNPIEGRVIDSNHPLYDRTLTGKVVVMPSTKGSSGNTMFVRIASLEGKAPAALIHKEIDSPLVLACAIANIPLVQIGETEFGLIQDGDWIEVDADEGIIEVKRKG